VLLTKKIEVKLWGTNMKYYKDLGYEGKEIGDALKQMLDAVIDGVVKNERDDLIQFLEKDDLEKDL
jgi:hypothetical protein